MSASGRASVRERVRRECACERGRACRGHLSAPTAAGAGRAAGARRGAGAPEPAGRSRDSSSPPPARVPRLPSAAGASADPGRPLPAAPLDVRGARAGPPPALAATGGPGLRPAGVERAGSRGLRPPAPPWSPPRPPGPAPQLPGLGGCDNGL